MYVNLSQEGKVYPSKPVMYNCCHISYLVRKILAAVWLHVPISSFNQNGETWYVDVRMLKRCMTGYGAAPSKNWVATQKTIVAALKSIADARTKGSKGKEEAQDERANHVPKLY